MKSFLVNLICACLSVIGFSQSVTITSPGVTAPTAVNVEVGDTVKFVAHWTSSGATLVAYHWNVPWNGEHQHDLSNIDGSTNFDTGNDPLVRTSSNSTDTIKVIWGDKFNDEDFDQVHVQVEYQKPGVGGNSFTVDVTYDVNIYRIFPPLLTGSNSIQGCCTTSKQYCDESHGDQNNWDWTVVGGTQTTSDGIVCMSLTPNSTGNVSVTCVATRTSNTHGYSRTSSKTITRTQPITPAISGPDYICKGSVLTLCTHPVCGMTGIQWTGDSNLTISSGQGDTCVTLTPQSSATNGTIVNVTAQATYSSGCTATIVSHPVAIYSGGAPPTPNGNVTIEFPHDFEPCSDEEFIYIIHYDGVYSNGIITVTPTIIVDVPHHHVHDQFEVEVCYHNLCGGGTTCRTYYMFLPEPCKDDEDPFLVSPVKKQKEIIADALLELHTRSDSDAKNLEELKFYPNPSNGLLTLQTNSIDELAIEVFDLNGIKIYQSQGYNGGILDISRYCSNGLYILKASSLQFTIFAKILINN